MCTSCLLIVMCFKEKATLSYDIRLSNDHWFMRLFQGSYNNIIVFPTNEISLIPSSSMR